MSACDFYAIGWIITLFGFLISNQQSNHRETRKETRAKLDKLNDLLDSLMDSSRNYYLNPEANLTSECLKIYEKLHALDRMLIELAEIKAGVDLHDKFYVIYENLTTGSFDSKNHSPGLMHSDMCKKVAIVKEDLVKESENWFTRTYKK
jgi:hypothetical protein